MSVTNDNSAFNPLTHQPPKYDIFGRLVKIIIKSLLIISRKKFHLYLGLTRIIFCLKKKIYTYLGSKENLVIQSQKPEQI